MFSFSGFFRVSFSGACEDPPEYGIVKSNVACSPAGLNFPERNPIEAMKNANRIRWIIAVLMLLALPLLISSPAVAEVKPLGLDMSVHGREINPDGWLSKNEYQDESIHVTVHSKARKPKSSADKTTCRWIVIDIADPSQLRTTMSKESYEDPSLARSKDMAVSVNAVVAMNADFIKYTYDFGYVIRQGVFYRDMLDSQKHPRDVLVIDDAGDFSIVPQASSADMAAHLAQMESEGLTAVNTFTFGPALVVDGEMQEVSKCPEHEAILATQRVCICQLDHLKYAIVEIDGGNGLGMNLQELARYVMELFPECKYAYNLDGGGSSHVLVNGKLIHKTLNSRPISDLIYFASAAEE